MLSSRLRAATAVTVIGSALLLPVVLAAPAAAATPLYAVTGTVGVGTTPQGVAVDPSTHTVYVTNTDYGGAAGTVSVIDGTSNRVTATIDVGDYSSPRGVAVDPSTHSVYVAQFGRRSVAVIDEVSNQVTATVGVGTFPDAVAVDPSTHRVYVTNRADNSVSVIDGTTNQVIATIDLGSTAIPRAIAVDPSTHTVYVAGFASDSVAVIDGTTNQITTTIAVDSPTGVAIDTSTHAVYVTDYYDNSVAVVDGSSRRVTGSFEVGIRPYGVAVDSTTHTVYVANYFDNSVSVVDGATTRTVATLAVGNGPVGVAVDESTHTAYVTNSGTNGGPNSNSVSVISAGNTPAVVGVSPTSGPVSGGLSVTVTGTDLTGATAVSFGGSAASSFTVDSSTQITAISPAGSGTVDVRVTTPFGTSATSAADRYTYVTASPTLTTTPSAGTAAGGSISDSAVLSGGSAPSGTVTFSLFGPADPTCAGPAVDTATVGVSGGAADSGAVTVTTAGTYRWTAAYSGDDDNDPAASGCGDETVVTAAALDRIAVSPASASVTAGRSQVYTAEGFDAYGNSRDVTGDVTFSVAGGSCTGAVCTPSTTVGSYPVTATIGAMSGSATLAVTPAVVVRIGLGLASAPVSAGRSRTYVVTAFDRFGNTRDVTPAATFSATGPVSCAGATCSSTTAGVGTVTASYKGNQASSQLRVVPAALASIAVGPAVTIEAGGSATFVVNGYDRFGNLRGAVTDGATLSASGVGSCADAVCTSTVAGGFTVTARYYAFQGSALVTVVPAALDHVRVSPRTAVVAVGGAVTYTVTAFDRYDNPRGVVTDDSTFTATTGATCNGAICTAARPGQYTVVATYAGVTAAATLRVVRSTTGGRAATD